MRDTDVQSRFEALSRDIERLTIIPQPDAPVRVARRRRSVRLAVVAAAVLAIASGVAFLTVVDRDRAADPAQRGPGQTGTLGQSAITRQLLQRVPGLPTGSTTFVTDVVSFSGSPGTRGTSATKRAIVGYLGSAAVTFEIEPLQGLLDEHLVTSVASESSQGFALFVLDVGPSDVRDRFGSAGWKDAGDDMLTPGPDVADPRTPRIAGGVRVHEIGDRQTLLSVAAEPDDLPDAADGTMTTSITAQRLLDLGGPVGYAVDVEEPCSLVAATLSSPTEASALLAPPDGVSAAAVTAEELSDLYEITAVKNVQPDGDLVRADLGLRNSQVPISRLRELGLPSASYC